MSLNCHFIFDQKLHSQLLSDRHPGANIAEELASVINEWNINDKIITIISDNGANVKNAITDHLRKDHHPCVAHTLNLSIKEALNGNAMLKLLISKCKALVAHFKHSALATYKLRQSQEQMGLPVLKVKQAVDTRWNSVLLMMERLLEIKDPLSVAVYNLPSSPDTLDASHWVIIRDITKIMKPLELMTIELSGEKYVTMSSIIPLVRGLQFQLKNMSPTTAEGMWLQKFLIVIIGRRLGHFETNKHA
jgi:hypothetical protein